MFKLLLYLSLLLFCACANRTDSVKSIPKVSVQWQYLTLELNDTVIQAVEATDTLEIATFKEGFQRYPIRHPEIDSLFSWSNALLDFQGQPKIFCTDYVGKLLVRIRYNSQLLKEVNFSSICNWRELDNNTRRIDHLLKEVVRAK
jgi:hypothetical protein